MSVNAEHKEESPYWPSLGGPIFLFLLVLFFFTRPLLLLGDGGTCRHFLTGMYIVQNLALPATTYMSAVEPNSPWTTHELLCDIVFGAPFNALGLNWVVLISSIAIALSLAWSYQLARIRGCGTTLSLIALVLALEACSVHWSARPHVLTYIFFLSAYYECFISQGSVKARSLYLAVIMFLWSNTHGSFPLGLAMILMRAAGDFILRTAQTPEAPASAEPSIKHAWTIKESLTILLPAAIAACLNLRGAGFINYVISYISNPKIQAHSDEWRSIDFSFAGPVWSYIALVLLLIACWTYSRIKPRLGEFAYMLFLFCSSMYAMRLIPYFALAALPAMAQQAGQLASSESLLKVPFIGRLLVSDSRASQSELALLKNRWICSAIAGALSLSFLFLPFSKIHDFDPTRMPVQAVDYMKEHGIKGLGYIKDNWGSYLYWRLNEKIFIDDKTDFYSQTLLDDYTNIFLTNPGWQKTLEKYPFKFVLIPRGLPLEFMLKENPMWKVAFEDGTAILFTKQ